MLGSSYLMMQQDIPDPESSAKTTVKTSKRALLLLERHSNLPTPKTLFPVF
jgi:hypothetical protein